MLGSHYLLFRFVKLYSERIPKILSCNSAFLLYSVILNCILVVVITNKASQNIHCEISFSMINALPVFSVPPLRTYPVVTLSSPSSLLCFLVALPLWSLHPTLEISSNNIQRTKHWYVRTKVMKSPLSLHLFSADSRQERRWSWSRKVTLWKIWSGVGDALTYVSVLTKLALISIIWLFPISQLWTLWHAREQNSASVGHSSWRCIQENSPRGIKLLHFCLI